ncbi:MAG TPA: hypothetical protein VFS08_11380 [Gemmatimonadaceae bacterium]|nr:hypothetical protein [Gemmatimonadaceae bacterium]
MPATEPAPRDAAAPLRRILLALVLLSTLGLLLELLLLEHFESVSQWLPLVLLGGVLGVSLVLVVRPGRQVIRIFQLLMLLCVVTGLLGIWLHYRGNVEFARELDPGLRGVALVWEAIRGATPTLAAGALAQLGLLGLAYTFRHPLLRPVVPPTLREAAPPAAPSTTGSRTTRELSLDAQRNGP